MGLSRSYTRAGLPRCFEELERVASRKIGNAKAWWLTDAGQRFLEETDADFAADLKNS